MYLSLCLKEYNFCLYFSCLIANLSLILSGYCIAWTTIAIPRLDGTTGHFYNPLKVSLQSSQKVWIVSVIPIAAAISSLLSGFLAERRGRKELLVVSSLFITLGLAAIYFSQYVPYLLLGRFTCGLGMGSAFTIIPLYLAEIAEDKNRGSLGMMMGTCTSLGMLMAYVFGSFMTLNELNMTFFVISFVFLLLVDWCLPESHHWLLSQDRSKDAEASLRQIRKYSNGGLINELIVLRKNIAEMNNASADLIDTFKKKHVLKSLCITCSLMLLQQIVSVSVVLFYIQPIFAERSSSQDEMPVTLLVVSAIQFFSCISASVLIDKIERNVLLMASTIGCGLSLVTLGVYFQLHNNSIAVVYLETVSIILFAITYATGLGPIPSIIMGQLFSTQVKGPAAAITICVCFISIVCSAAAFLPVLNLIGEAPSFWILALICFIGGLMIYFFVPETKRKSLQEIQEDMRN